MPATFCTHFHISVVSKTPPKFVFLTTDTLFQPLLPTVITDLRLEPAGVDLPMLYIHRNNINKYRSYLTVNALRLYYKHLLINNHGSQLQS